MCLQQSYMISPKKSFLGGETGGGLHGSGTVAASLRLIPVFSGGKWSVHEKHAECIIIILSAASLSLSLSSSLALFLSLSPPYYEN